ncbi:MAG: response regulator [Gemmatimonadota bacterium]|nr:response regulator [Gemmatimonadota bacterium]
MVSPTATVLLVEDNPDNQAVYHVILEHVGYRVLAAWDGEEGVRLAREALPDAIVMDVTMPRMSGLEATRILKADDRTAAIPILILTAHAHDSDRREAEDAGCDAYLSKPALPRAVIAAVERMIGTAAPGACG